MAERTDEQLRLRATLASIAPGTALRDGLAVRIRHGGGGTGSAALVDDVNGSQ